MPPRNTATRDRHRAIIARGKPDCALCHEPIDYALKFPDPMSYEVDHILPVAHHPELADELSNKQPSHRKCNRLKWDKVEGAEPTARTFITSRSW